MILGFYAKMSKEKREDGMLHPFAVKLNEWFECY